MTKKKAVEVGVILMAMAAALTLVSIDKTGIRDWISILPTWFFTICSVLGFVLGLAGILSVILPLETIQEIVFETRDILGCGEKAFETKIAKRHDLKPIHEFGKLMMGTTVSDLQRAERWFETNRQIFWIVVDHSRRRPERKLIGYYAVFPLNKKATALLQAEQVDGTTFEPGHIIPFKPKAKRKTPSSIYIGGVAGRNRKRIRSFVLGSLISHLKHEKEAGVRMVFTRPVTKDGLRLVKKYKFEAVNKVLRERKEYKMDHIYRYEFPPDSDELG